MQAASWTLQERVAFDRTRITSRDWATYPILRFEDVFRSVEVYVIDRPNQPYLGTGEGGKVRLRRQLPMLWPMPLVSASASYRLPARA